MRSWRARMCCWWPRTVPAWRLRPPRSAVWPSRRRPPSTETKNGTPEPPESRPTEGAKSMRIHNTSTAAELQEKYGAYVLKIIGQPGVYRRQATTYREPITGQEVCWATPPVAVRKLLLPYCRITCDDGQEFLLNREYKAIWTRTNGGPAIRAPEGRWPSGRDVWF